MCRLRMLERALAPARRRPYHVGLASLCVGLALAPAPRAAAVLAAALLVALTAGRAPALGALAAALVIAGAALGGLRLAGQ
jgi:hypothetical protein